LWVAAGLHRKLKEYQRNSSQWADTPSAKLMFALGRQAALEHAPTNVRILRRLAKVEHTALDFAASEQHLRAALAIDPRDTRCIVELADSLLRQVRYDEAADLLRGALRDRPDDAAILSQLGRVLRWSGANREAEVYLDRAIKLDSDDAAAMLEKAMIHEEQGDFEPALVWHRRVADISGESYNATAFCSSLLAAGRAGTEAWGRNRHRVENCAFARLPGIQRWQVNRCRESRSLSSPKAASAIRSATHAASTSLQRVQGK
jgi:tetratricopeptide (TPR) repeat protein